MSERPTRRRFIGWAVAGVALGGGALAALRTRGYELSPAVAGQLRVLSAWQYRVIEAFGARVLDPVRADVAGFADGYFEGLAAADRRDLLAFVAYLEHAAPLSIGKLGRFTDLSDAERDRVIAAIETGPIGLLRGGLGALKAVAMMAYYRLPESWAEIGYSGPVVKWQK